ncbi:MAG TPA: PIN domain-containing protein [Verrucomicrobiae bacterium]|jgi:predicted nucleic acid-binding protein
MKCVDTSVLISLERNEAARARLADEDFFVPALAAAEFLVGVRLTRSETQRQRGQDFYDDIAAFVLPLSESQARIVANLIVDQRRKGKTLDPYDAAIAAAAIDSGAELVTHDKDFDGIAGLTVEKI